MSTFFKSFAIAICLFSFSGAFAEETVVLNQTDIAIFNEVFSASAADPEFFSSCHHICFREYRECRASGTQTNMCKAFYDLCRSRCL